MALGPRIGAIGSFGSWKLFLNYRVSVQSTEAKARQERESELKLRYNLSQQWDVMGEYHQAETSLSEKNYKELGLSARYSF